MWKHVADSVRRVVGPISGSVDQELANYGLLATVEGTHRRRYARGQAQGNPLLSPQKAQGRAASRPRQLR